MDDLTIRKEPNLQTIGRLFNTPIGSIDVDEKIIKEFNNSIKYRHLVIATGLEAKPLGVPGQNLEYIYNLQNFADAEAIYQEAEGRYVTIIGSDFDCYELATKLLETGPMGVNVVDPSDMPLKILGEEISTEIKQMLAENGIKIYSNATVKEFVGNNVNNNVDHIVLEDGRTIDPTYLVIIRQNYKPATSFLEGSKIDLNQNGYVVVDKNMKTNQTDVYAIGDVTEFPIQGIPSDESKEKRLSFSGWQLAQEQGRRAARSILGKDKHSRLVPFYWMDILGHHINYCGNPTVKYDNTISRGTIKDDNKVTYFLKDDEVVAVASCDSEGVAVQFLEIFQQGKTVLLEDIEKTMKYENNTFVDLYVFGETKYD